MIDEVIARQEKHRLVMYNLIFLASASKWERFGDSMYKFELDIAREVDTTHVDASFQCQSADGWLVSIESTAEQEFIQQKIREKVESQGQTFAREQWWTSGHWNKNEEKWTWHNSLEGRISQVIGFSQ